MDGCAHSASALHPTAPTVARKQAFSLRHRLYPGAIPQPTFPRWDRLALGTLLRHRFFVNRSAHLLANPGPDPSALMTRWCSAKRRAGVVDIFASLRIV